MRNLNGRGHGITLSGDKVALRRHSEIARAGKGDLATGQFNLKIPITIQRQIKRIAGLLQIALRLNPAGADNRNTCAKVKAHGISGLIGGLLTGNALFLISQSGEISAVAFEARRADIGQVIGNHAHARILRLKPGAGDVKSGIGHGSNVLCKLNALTSGGSTLRRGHARSK